MSLAEILTPGNDVLTSAGLKERRVARVTEVSVEEPTPSWRSARMTGGRDP